MLLILFSVFLGSIFEHKKNFIAGAKKKKAFDGKPPTVANSTRHVKSRVG